MKDVLLYGGLGVTSPAMTTIDTPGGKLSIPVTEVDNIKKAISLYNDAYGLAYKYNFSPPKWEDFKNGKGQQVVDEYRAKVAGKTQSNGGMSLQANNTITYSVLLPVSGNKYMNTTDKSKYEKYQKYVSLYNECYAIAMKYGFAKPVWAQFEAGQGENILKQYTQLEANKIASDKAEAERIAAEAAARAKAEAERVAAEAAQKAAAAEKAAAERAAAEAKAAADAKAAQEAAAKKAAAEKQAAEAAAKKAAAEKEAAEKAAAEAAAKKQAAEKAAAEAAAKKTAEAAQKAAAAEKAAAEAAAKATKTATTATTPALATSTIDPAAITHAAMTPAATTETSTTEKKGIPWWVWAIGGVAVVGGIAFFSLRKKGGKKGKE